MGLRQHDLEFTVDPIFEIDSYKSKMGDDQDIVVLSFSVQGEQPAKDLVRLLQIRDYKSDKNTTYIPKALSKRWCSKKDVMIGRYGPVIKYEKAGETKFIPVKEDIDFEKLKRGEYTLDEIKKEKNYGGKVLGLFKENPVILKNGKFGLYVNWNNKNYSLKGIRKNEEDIILSDVIEVLLGKKLKTNPNILLEIDEYLTIRKGKYGPYIFYKKENMSKPMFLSLKNKKDWKKSSNKELRDWIKMEHNI